jgi:hypothetical protein
MELLSFVGPWLLFVCLLTLFSVSYFASGKYTNKGLARTSTLSAGLGFLCWYIGFSGIVGKLEHPSLLSLTYALGAYSWGVSIAADFCLILGSLRASEFKWRSRELLALHSVAGWALFFAPSMLGESSGIVDRLASSSALPRVILSDDQHWRLLRASADSLVLANLSTPSPYPPIRVVKATDAVLIEQVSNP